MEQRREAQRKKNQEEEAERERQQKDKNPYDLMGEGIANEILGQQNTNG